MNILLAGQAYFREDNGQAVFTVRIARELARWGHRVMVLAPSENGRTGSEEQRGVELWRVRTIPLLHNVNVSLFSGRAVHEAVTGFSPDIVHLQDHYFICRTVWRVTRKLGIPTVGTNHFLPENLTANLPLPRLLKRPLNRLLWSHMLSLYNALAAVSTPTETAAAILYSQEIRPRVTAISCGVDTDRFHPFEEKKRRQQRKRLDFKGKAPVFLYVGRLDHEKGLDTVIKALALINRPDCYLVLAGRGSFYKQLKRLCRWLYLQDRVRFPGFIPEEDLPRLFNAADCFIMAGYAELQSIATLEAMACGLPVIAANARALPELVGHGENGLLFQPRDIDSLADAMNEYLRSADRWHAWSTENRKKAERHGLENTVRQYLDWYKNVIEEKVLSDALVEWSALPPERQLELREQFGCHLDTLPPTCRMETKLSRFQGWLQEQGVSCQDECRN